MLKRMEEKGKVCEMCVHDFCQGDRIHLQVPMIDDEDDFKESNNRGVAKKGHMATKKTKRSRRQFLEDSGKVKFSASCECQWRFLFL